jgi:hypothetical protein
VSVCECVYHKLLLKTPCVLVVIEGAHLYWSGLVFQLFTSSRPDLATRRHTLLPEESDRGGGGGGDPRWRARLPPDAPDHIARFVQLTHHGLEMGVKSHVDVTGAFVPGKDVTVPTADENWKREFCPTETSGASGGDDSQQQQKTDFEIKFQPGKQSGGGAITVGLALFTTLFCIQNTK